MFTGAGEEVEEGGEAEDGAVVGQEVVGQETVPGDGCERKEVQRPAAGLRDCPPISANRCGACRKEERGGRREEGGARSEERGAS